MSSGKWTLDQAEVLGNEKKAKQLRLARTYGVQSRANERRKLTRAPHPAHRAGSRDRMRAWRERNPGGAYRANKRYRDAHGDRFKTKHAQHRYRSKYGIQPGELRALWEAQGGRCPICRGQLHSAAIPGSQTPDSKPLNADHCHKTATTLGSVRLSVRGLLCGGKSCNYMLTKFWTVEKLRRAADYLEYPPAVQVLRRSRGRIAVVHLSD